MKKTITLYTPNRNKVQDVINSFEKLKVEIEKNNKTEVSLHVYTPDTNYFTQEEFLISVHRDDVVIVDATIPDGLNEQTKTIYPILTAQVNTLDHVLVFSRQVDEKGYDVLPLNISPIRKRENEDALIPWLKRQIIEILTDENYPYKRLSISSINDLMAYRQEMEDMISCSIKMQQEREKVKSKGKRRVMISYRNSHSAEVELFAKDFNPGYEVDIKALPPGSLCGDSEALTPMRRWMLVGLLEAVIRQTDEVWVYWTEDYTQSWWTMAEMVMVAYVNRDRKANPVRLKIYDPIQRELYDASHSLTHHDMWQFVQVVINNEQAERLARVLSNSRPDTMGPEVMQQVDQMRTILGMLRITPAFLKKRILNQIQNVMSQAVPVSLTDEERQQMLDKMMEMYRDEFKLEAYINDDVFKEEFWHNISYQTDKQSKANRNGLIDVDTFLSRPMEELTDFSETELEQNVDKEISIERENVTHKYIVNRGPKRYLWLATRNNIPTIKTAPGLELIPAFNFKESDLE